MARYDDSLLRAALLGYEQEHARITLALADVRKRLGRSDSASTVPATGGVRTGRNKRRISPEGRARIAEAQRKRWAAAKKNKA